MIVESYALGGLMTNAYLLYDEEKMKGIVIDPGESPGVLLERVSELRLHIEAILLTHAHFDHIAGLNEVRQKTQAPVYIHQLEKDWLVEPDKNGSSLWPNLPHVICEPADVLLSGGETLSFFGETFQVKHTPGHSPGSVTFVYQTQMFAGDVLFAGSIGRTDLPGGNHQQLMDTIQSTFLSMSDDVIVRPGHGPSTTIGEERATNPFLR